MNQLHLCIISGFRWQSSNSDTFGPCRRAFRFAHGPVYIQSLDRSFIAIQFDYGGKRHLYRTLDCNGKKYYFCTVEQSRMNHDRTYRPISHVPAPRLRDADGSMRQAPRRSAGHTATHPVPPLKGLPGTRATDVPYRALAPGGTCWPRGCAVLPSFGPWRGWLLLPDLHRHFQIPSNCSLLTANC